VDIQRSLARYNETNEAEQLHVRVGISAGEPVTEHDDLFGTAVQLAARLCDQASRGSICCSSVVRELVVGKGFEFDQRGAVELKGFAEPVTFFEVRWV
jgi:adenylate cyclase